jgi:hypothetical protein
MSGAACTASAPCSTQAGIAKTDTACTTAKAEQPAKTKTWTFSISIGSTNPLRIQGTITQSEADDPPLARH